MAGGTISGAFFLTNVFLAVTLFLGGINGANSTTSSFTDTAIVSILAAAVGAEGWAFAAAVANHGSFSAAAAVSRLSGLHVRRPLRTSNPSADSASSGNRSRSVLCYPGTSGGGAACGSDVNPGHVVLSGTPTT